MNTRIFDAFESRQKQVKEYMAGCGMRYGMECTCGPNCRCTNCPIHSNNNAAASDSDEEDCCAQQQQPSDEQQQAASMQDSDMQPDPSMFDTALQIEQPMDFFEMPSAQPPQQLHNNENNYARAQRNPSVISFNGLRHMSLTSETTFGRAMSGLSALSIDWENLDDFDVEVDHSAHINNTPKDGRRSSMRRSFKGPPKNVEVREEANVKFKE
jgi:hypothetical protein